jgi:hypothetical protein
MLDNFLFGALPYIAILLFAVLGWPGAVAADGPFFVSTLVGRSTSATGSAAAFFVGAIAFYVIATAINGGTTRAAAARSPADAAARPWPAGAAGGTRRPPAC